MLELIILYMLCRSIRRIAESKGQSPVKYITYTILLWFGLEALFYMLGLVFFRAPLLAYFFALIGAALGGLIAYRIATNSGIKYSDYEEVE
jgi:hypothetical protein